MVGRRGDWLGRHGGGRRGLLGLFGRLFVVGRCRTRVRGTGVVGWLLVGDLKEWGIEDTYVAWGDGWKGEHGWFCFVFVFLGCVWD